MEDGRKTGRIRGGKTKEAKIKERRREGSEGKGREKARGNKERRRKSLHLKEG